MGCAPSIGLHALNMQSNITVFDQWRNAWRNKVVLKSSHGEWPFFHPAYLLGVIITPIYKCPLAPQTKISHPNLAWFQVSWKNRRIMHAHLSNWIIASKKKSRQKSNKKHFTFSNPKTPHVEMLIQLIHLILHRVTQKIAGPNSHHVRGFRTKDRSIVASAEFQCLPSQR